MNFLARKANRISRKLFAWKYRFGKYFGKLVIGGIRILPIKTLWKAAICEQIALTGTIPFSKNRNIYLKINSFFDSKRLSIKEPETIRWLADYLKPGEVFYDVGANNGIFSLWASFLNPGQNEIFSFEPGFSSFNVLCENVFLNQKQNQIKPFNVAFSGKTGLRPFIYSTLSSGAATHSLAENLPENKNLYQYVLAYQLDEFVKKFNLPRPNHLKIDVDGGEYEVLSGARGTLLDPELRSILLEIDEEKEFANEILELLKQSGFLIRERYPKANSKIANCIFFRPKTQP